MFDWLKIGAGVLAGAALGYIAGQWRGENTGYEKRIAETAAADVKADLQRKGDDATLQRLSNYDLCVLGLRAQRMPIDACEQLRGIREEQSVPGGNGGADPG